MHFDVFCKYVKKDGYKKIGGIDCQPAFFLPIGSHIWVSGMEVEIVSYLFNFNDDKNTIIIAKLIDESADNYYKNKKYEL